MTSIAIFLNVFLAVIDRFCLIISLVVQQHKISVSVDEIIVVHAAIV